MFVRGREYNRRQDLHAKYGGQQQGGISTPRSLAAILLFTGGSGAAHGYDDGWLPSGVFRYFGEGQRGDMQLLRGNRAIHDHVADGRALHLFAQSRSGHVRYEGEMTCSSFELVEKVPDTDGKLRTAIAFHLVPVTELASADQLLDEPEEPTVHNAPPDAGALKLLAYASKPPQSTPSEGFRWVYRRARVVRTYVLRRADGQCEGCAAPAPFRDKADAPYLEAHHVSMLADGGPDLPNAVIALCPSCHRRVHYGIDGDAFNEQLKDRLGTIEP